jgi:hexokinase
MEIFLFRVVRIVARLHRWVAVWRSVYRCDLEGLNILKLQLGEMLINIEWGAFDNEKTILPVTKYDVTIDKATDNVGKQIFEKMTSGLYLGEITRYGRQS